MMRLRSKDKRANERFKKFVVMSMVCFSGRRETIRLFSRRFEMLKDGSRYSVLSNSGKDLPWRRQTTCLNLDNHLHATTLELVVAIENGATERGHGK